MSETPFFKTRMGQRLYERTMPEFVKQLELLVKVLERIADQPPTTTDSSRDRDGRAST